MSTRRVAFVLAGLLWLGLGILMVLTVFGTFLGLVMAYLVGIRRSTTAAQVGAFLGLLLFLPGQMILEMAGCDHAPCSPEPYLMAYVLPLAVTGLNLYAGWPVKGSVTKPAPPPPGGGTATTQPPTGWPAPTEAPGQQMLWDALDRPTTTPGRAASPNEPPTGDQPGADRPPASLAMWSEPEPAVPHRGPAPRSA